MVRKRLPAKNGGLRPGQWGYALAFGVAGECIAMGGGVILTENDRNHSSTKFSV
jgi:hypothetical protein